MLVRLPLFLGLMSGAICSSRKGRTRHTAPQNAALRALFRCRRAAAGPAGARPSEEARNVQGRARHTSMQEGASRRHPSTEQDQQDRMRTRAARLTVCTFQSGTPLERSCCLNASCCPTTSFRSTPACQQAWGGGGGGGEGEGGAGPGGGGASIITHRTDGRKRNTEQAQQQQPKPCQRQPEGLIYEWRM